MGDERPGRRTPGSAVLTPPTGVPVVTDLDGRGPEIRGGAAPHAPVPAEIEAVVGSCLCGHGAQLHEHWRPGSDCAVCGSTGCPSFRRQGGGLRRVLRGLRLAH